MVRYGAMNAMLLDEFLKEHREMATDIEAKIRANAGVNEAAPAPALAEEE